MSCRASPADLDSEEQKLVPKNKNKQTNKQLHLKEELNREEHTCIINFKRLHRKQLASEGNLYSVTAYRHVHINDLH